MGIISATYGLFVYVNTMYFLNFCNIIVPKHTLCTKKHQGSTSTSATWPSGPFDDSLM